MDQQRSFTFLYKNCKASKLSDFSMEDHARLMKSLASWKKRLIETAVDQHLSIKYPDETFQKKWEKQDE